ncbi:MAG: hypothetical protein K2N28_07350 [Muribaculaceae bacterium]|nr:hypothetical protein [Muribaculaceae bacterium]
MEYLGTIADFLFGWVLDANAEDYNIFCNTDVLAWVLIALVAISLCAVCIFYHGVSKVAANATRKNYRVIFVLGLLVLWLANFILIPTIVDDWSYAFGFNNLFVSLIDTFYYACLYELFSFFVKEKSNAPHLILHNCIF